jgi:hypothetical protein
VRALGAKRQAAGVAAEESRRQGGGRSMVSLTLGVFFWGRMGFLAVAVRMWGLRGGWMGGLSHR